MRRVGVGALLVVCLVAVTGCITGEWTGDPEDLRVAVVGDSLVYHAECVDQDCDERMTTNELVGEDFYAWVTGIVGLDVAQAIELWRYTDLRDGIDPDVLVIALGTNDMRVSEATGEPRTTPEEAQVVLEEWLGALPHACVRLIGVAESVHGWGLDVTGPGWNEMLAEVAAQHPDAAYVAWEPKDEWTDDGADPHLWGDGREAYRELISRAAVDCDPREAAGGPPEQVTRP